MSIKKFFVVFGSLFLVLVLIVGAAAFTYPDVYTSKSRSSGGKDASNTKLKDASGIYNVLLIGRDRGGSLTDTIMFVRVDNDKEEVNILSIPRDTYVDGWKINAMYSFGDIEYTIECVEDIVGLEVDYYVSITTDIFRDIVDELDGVQFYVPQNMDYEDPFQDLYIHLREGDQLLDGDKAEQLVRFRSYPQGDLQRTQVQRDFIQALITQKKSLKYINRVDDVYQSVADDIETNLTLDDILSNIITFKNLDATNDLKAYIMPNDPQNVNGISYVFVIDDELRELLITEFGVDESEFNSRSGKHVYTAGGGYTGYDTDYDDETAWFEPEASDELSLPDEDGVEDIPEDEYSEDETEYIPEESETTDTEEGTDDYSSTYDTEPDVSVSTDVYEEYPDAAGVPLD